MGIVVEVELAQGGDVLLPEGSRLVYQLVVDLQRLTLKLAVAEEEHTDGGTLRGTMLEGEFETIRSLEGGADATGGVLSAVIDIPRRVHVLFVVLAFNGDGIDLVAICDHFEGKDLLTLRLELEDAVLVAVVDGIGEFRALRLHVILLFKFLDDSCGQGLSYVEGRFELRGKALVRLHIVVVDDDIKLGKMFAAQGVLQIDEGVFHAWRRNSLTTVQLAREEIFTVRVLQLFADAADGHGLHVAHEHLRVACGIAAIGIKLLPRLVGISKILRHVVLLIVGTVWLLRVRPVDHLHVVRVEVIEENGLGRGVTNLGHSTVKTVNSEGVVVGSTRCLTFIRASGHHSQRTRNNERKMSSHHSAF